MTFDRWLLLLAMVCASGCAMTGAGAGAAATPAAAAPTSATAGATTIVAVQPAAAPASPPCTIWQFLGVPGAAKGVCSIVGCIQNRLGTLFPGLEAKPPLLAITDPANMQSSNPAVSAAAGAKADEDAAPQKVKAINYLGTIGCGGCYPDVQDALLAALDDCTEAVRFAAVNALRGTACGQCKVCRKKSCCSPKVMEKLYKVANDVDDTGCYKEPSPRVRRMARLAMAACGGGVPAPTSAPLEGPAEGPPATPPAPASPVVRAAAPPTRVAARAPVAVAAAAARPQAKPAQPATQQPAQETPTAPTASQPVPAPQAAVPPEAAPAVDTPPAASDVEQAEPSNSTPALPTAAASVTSRSQSAAKASAAAVQAPPAAEPPGSEPAATQGEETDQPARVRPAPTGPATVKESLPAVVRAAADAASAPVAVATGIELMQPSLEAAPASSAEPPVNPPAATISSAPVSKPAATIKPALPVVLNNQNRSANPAGQPQAGTRPKPAAPPPASEQAQAAAGTSRQGSGPLVIFQSQGSVNRANVIRNPFVDETSDTGKKQIALVSGNQALPGDPAAPARATQLANWQAETARPAAVQNSQPAAAPQATVSDEQLLAYYQQNAGNYRGPPEVRWTWIHLPFDSFGTRPDAYAAGAAVRQAAVEGQIAAAVQKYPRTEVRSFTWTPATLLPSRAMAKALLQMRAGEVSVMMASASGVEIVQLLEARPTTLSFEQARERVRSDLSNQSRR